MPSPDETCTGRAAGNRMIASSNPPPGRVQEQPSPPDVAEVRIEAGLSRAAESLRAIHERLEVAGQLVRVGVSSSEFDDGKELSAVEPDEATRRASVDDHGVTDVDLFHAGAAAGAIHRGLRGGVRAKACRGRRRGVFVIQLNGVAQFALLETKPAALGTSPEAAILRSNQPQTQVLTATLHATGT